jgi:hypothetical protein
MGREKGDFMVNLPSFKMRSEKFHSICLNQYSIIGYSLLSYGIGLGIKHS